MRDPTELRPVGEGDHLLAQLHIRRKEDAPFKDTLWVAAHVAVQATTWYGARDLREMLRTPAKPVSTYNLTEFYAPLGTGLAAEGTIQHMRATIHTLWDAALLELLALGEPHGISTEVELFRRAGGLIVPGYPMSTDQLSPPESPPSAGS